MQSVSLCNRLSKKLSFLKVWQVKVGQNKDLVCYRKKQSFRQCAWGLRQLLLKPGFRSKGRAMGMLEKSENFNSLRPILFELCKKTTGWGVKLTPPAGIGLISLLTKQKEVKFIRNTTTTLWPHSYPTWIFRTSIRIDKLIWLRISISNHFCSSS